MKPQLSGAFWAAINAAVTQALNLHEGTTMSPMTDEKRSHISREFGARLEREHQERERHTDALAAHVRAAKMEEAPRPVGISSGQPAQTTEFDHAVHFLGGQVAALETLVMALSDDLVSVIGDGSAPVGPGGDIAPIRECDREPPHTTADSTARIVVQATTLRAARQQLESLRARLVV